MPDPEALKKAKNQALKYLSYRDRSKWEITQYLEKKQHSHLVIQQTLEYLETSITLMINDLHCNGASSILTRKNLVGIVYIWSF